MRVLDDRSRSELAAEGLEDPHPQPHARRAGQRRVLLVRAGPLYGKQLQLAPGGPHGDGLAAAGGADVPLGTGPGVYLPARRTGAPSAPAGWRRFALCLCWELPTVLQTLVQEGGGALLSPTLLFRLGLCCVGALGALSAVRCTRTEQGA